MSSKHTTFKCGCCNREITKNNVEQFRVDITAYRKRTAKSYIDLSAKLAGVTVIGVSVAGGFSMSEKRNLISLIKLATVALVVGWASKVFVSRYGNNQVKNLFDNTEVVVCKECFRKGYRLDNVGDVYVVTNIDQEEVE